MGTDIHGVFQRHNATIKKWENVETEFEFNRHYQLFAVLAGVRNGYGFGWVPTGEVVTPISHPRGIPRDFSVSSTGHFGEKTPGLSIWDGGRAWLGDHSFSWLMSSEMLIWTQYAPVVLKVGVLERSVYESWDKQTTPASYCGDAYGPNIRLINDSEIERQATPNWNYIRCNWQISLADELAYFFNEVRRLHDLHGGVRFVFGFDS